MKTLRILPWLVVAGMTTGSASTQPAGQADPASGTGQDSVVPQQQVGSARTDLPVYLFDLYGKTPSLSRIRRAGIQEQTTWPRFRRQYRDTPPASTSEWSARTFPRIRELRSPSGSYAGIAWEPDARPRRAPAVRSEVALIASPQQKSETGEVPIPTPTGKASGRQAPLRAEHQPVVEHPRVSELNDPEAEAVQQPATDPGTALSRPLAPTPTGKASGRPAPTVENKEQALAELLRLYLKDSITPGEYHERRSQILAEP